MKVKKRRPVVIFSLCGFALSLGGPLGFYLHNYFFNNPGHASLYDHILWIHQHQFSTILYIGLGTNIFFTLFSALLGYLLEKAFIQEGKLMHLKRSQKDLLVHSLNRMREPTSIGIESLMCLRRDHLREEDKIRLLDSAIIELVEIDNALQDLLQMEARQWSVISMPSSQVVDLMENIGKNNDIQFPTSDKSRLVPIHVHIPERPLTQAIDRIFKWLRKNELTVENVSFLYQVDMFQLHIILTGNYEGHELDDALLIALIEYGEGRCFIHENAIHLCLPATVTKEKAA